MSLQLRPYPEYKESGMSWLGRVPAHWQLIKMKYLFRERSIKGYPNEPLLAATQTLGVIPKDHYDTRTVLATKDLHLLKLVLPGDFVISLRSFQGGIESAGYRGIISPAYTVLTLTQLAVQAYFARLLKTRPFVKNLSIFVTGIRQGQNIDYQRLSMLCLPIPSYEEQQLMASFIASVDRKIKRLIHSKRRLIELLNEQKQAIIHQAVTRGLDPNVRLKPSGIDWLGEVPEHWELVPLKYICGRYQNGVTPPTQDRAYYMDGTIPWYGPTSINQNIEVQKPVGRLNPKALCDGKARNITPPALMVVVIGASAGKSALLTNAGCCNQQITAFELEHEKVEPSFVAYQFRMYEKWLHSTASSATIPIINGGILARTPIALPLIIEQRMILDKLKIPLESLTTAIEMTQKEINYLHEYRTRLIADVVTGKLDVRGVKLDEAVDTTDFLEYFEENAAEIESEKEMDTMEGLDE